MKHFLTYLNNFRFVVLNNFMKNLLNEKSRDRNARLSNAQTSSSYNRTLMDVDPGWGGIAGVLTPENM